MGQIGNLRMSKVITHVIWFIQSIFISFEHLNLQTRLNSFTIEDWVFVFVRIRFSRGEDIMSDAVPLILGLLVFRIERCIPTIPPSLFVLEFVEKTHVQIYHIQLTINGIACRVLRRLSVDNFTWLLRTMLL